MTIIKHFLKNLKKDKTEQSHKISNKIVKQPINFEFKDGRQLDVKNLFQVFSVSSVVNWKAIFIDVEYLECT